MNKLILVTLVASEIGVSLVSARSGLRVLPFAIGGGIGYIFACAFGLFLFGAFVGEKAPFGPALGWIGVCFAAIAFFKSEPAERKKPVGLRAAMWALAWRAVLAVMLAGVCGVFGDLFVLNLAGFVVGALGASDEAIIALGESRVLYYFIVAVYVVLCAMCSVLFFWVFTNSRLDAVQSTLVPYLKREA